LRQGRWQTKGQESHQACDTNEVLFDYSHVQTLDQEHGKVPWGSGGLLSRSSKSESLGAIEKTGLGCDLFAWRTIVYAAANGKQPE
jgi:hypothetical protein